MEEVFIPYLSPFIDINSRYVTCWGTLFPNISLVTLVCCTVVKFGGRVVIAFFFTPFFTIQYVAFVVVMSDRVIPF